jgi:hypothetical protein
MEIIGAMKKEDSIDSAVKIFIIRSMKVLFILLLFYFFPRAYAWVAWNLFDPKENVGLDRYRFAQIVAYSIGFLGIMIEGVGILIIFKKKRDR